eukprot:CAMPEP_0206448858 /NCGR_PEP_ID=MMETSP0324_2-20121206/17743_1 /ASSEMBLY_ACC=CAM_ASM_000836 /TAXON_ID=2866 /ORGANISM="Crypthecodinium cohnii, Strain Seligo" /LENGTH=72 /DNA_ID=CAMNT_0053918123 /DNA_START=290 /DNA_END=506 /DNA_ORIENTATION=+
MSTRPCFWTPDTVGGDDNSYIHTDFSSSAGAVRVGKLRVQDGMCIFGDEHGTTSSLQLQVLVSRWGTAPRAN